MATTALPTGYLTLLDRVKRSKPDGSIDPKIVEQLTQRCSFLQVAHVEESNQPLGHLVTSRTGLPSVAWKVINKGTAPSKSKTDQFTEPVGTLEAWSAIDKKNADINGNSAAFRYSEDIAFLQSFKNELETAMFYASTKATPEKVHGLSPRMDVLGAQVITGDASPSGNDQTSIWGICFGPKGVYMLTPKGQASGIQFKDYGLRPWNDPDGNPIEALVGHWEWNTGLCVEDGRQIVRIPNVDTSALTADASAGAKLIEKIITAHHQIFDPTMGRMAWFGNRKIGTFLHLQAMNQVKGSSLTLDEFAGRKITHILGAPFFETDALTNTEAVVS